MIRHMILVLLTIAFVTGMIGYIGAISTPLIRTAKLHDPAWPSDAPPLRIALLSDIHVAGPDMPPGRLARIVEQVNDAKPDVVLIAGDFISDKRVATRTYPVTEALAPLRILRSRFGTYAVLGNHDHWRDEAAFRRILPEMGITLLQNEAAKVGTIVLVGVGDDFSDHADIATAFSSAQTLAGPRVVLTHSPDIVPDLPQRVALVAAGHTHCGQIDLPVIGRPATMSRYGDRFACGVINDNGQKVVVGAGVGTSLLPIRIGAPPDFWIIELGR